MSSIIDFNWKLKELSSRIRDLNNSNDELTKQLAITQAELMLDEYKYDLASLDSYQSSQFCQALLALLSKLE